MLYLLMSFTYLVVLISRTLTTSQKMRPSATLILYLFILSITFILNAYRLTVYLVRLVTLTICLAVHVRLLP